ncbi:uncharacterized protein LOC129801126 [Phlebotomus papatasi]|uniref:uncharacterized protein LOC129801126 n=1 Tax=Phlebotomus papatasi TaxID=29031 RepID=UPI0024834E75|nr:uncharacterized protein LOC129801126 [Phlebotomus papatasi]
MDRIQILQSAILYNEGDNTESDVIHEFLSEDEDFFSQDEEEIVEYLEEEFLDEAGDMPELDEFLKSEESMDCDQGRTASVIHQNPAYSANNAEVESEFYTKCKGGSLWSKKPFLLSKKVPAHNKIRGPVNKFVLPPGIVEPDDFLILFLKDIIPIVILHTNAYGEKYYAEKDKKNQWKPVDEKEMKAFIGILFLSAAFNLESRPIQMIWDQSYGVNVILATMSRNRFQEIMQFLRFDDRDSRSTRKEKDKLAPSTSNW